MFNQIIKEKFSEIICKYPTLKKIFKQTYIFFFSLFFFIPLRLFTQNSFIPIIEIFGRHDRIVRKGKFAGTRCYYKTALLNTLIKLRPKICLEIGTNYGGTAKIFKYYFKKYKPGGVLITADIRKYIDLGDKHIKQVLVYSHMANIENHHDVFARQMLSGFHTHLNDSVKANCEILKRELRKIDADAFEFCFIDGDHQEISFLRDLEIAKKLSHFPHYALLDDTKEEEHECSFVYNKELVKKVSHYDFDDWPIFIGMSLIWEKDKESLKASDK
ncbi:MAG: hypothetical protein ACKKMO_02090 [Candidatus Nealsonbacteria bacterium]